jgi:dimethylhistidine N-methyltransferase
MSEATATTVLAGLPALGKFRHDVLHGLSQMPKRLPCKYFYDRRGSMLFDAICVQREYYLTRIEQQIMREHCTEMANELGPATTLVEYGSGSSIKTRYLLESLRRPTEYMPVDISREHLLTTAERLRRDFPDVPIHPVCADFTAEFRLPPSRLDSSRPVVYFPGSTIGNFEPTGAVSMLSRIAQLVEPDGGLLVGIDLVKDVEIIERAYNDAAGVTAEFNLNILLRINRELRGDFDLDKFEHLAFYDTRFNRVDLRLVGQCDQQVHVNGRVIRFRAGEAIHTEYSHKYTIDRFTRLACEAKLKLRRVWTDARNYFAVLYLVHQDCQ